VGPFFEIFFFKNFQNPDYEVERFCANYEASGWIRKNGQAATDRPALARTWTQEDKNAAPRFNADFLAPYRRFYGLAKQMNPALAPIFIHDSAARGRWPKPSKPMSGSFGITFSTNISRAGRYTTKPRESKTTTHDEKQKRQAGQVPGKFLRQNR
jgi:hypothetical protein